MYEVAEDVIVVEADGTARWNLTAEQITVDHLLRAAGRRLLRGDPLRPYLVLLLPQGGEAFQTAWEVTLAAWQILTNLLAAHDLYTLLRGARREEIQKGLKDGTDVVDRYRARWIKAGGGPSELMRTMERRPWPVATSARCSGSRPRTTRGRCSGERPAPASVEQALPPHRGDLNAQRHDPARQPDVAGLRPATAAGVQSVDRGHG
jgi:hypothetical protein